MPDQDQLTPELLKALLELQKRNASPRDIKVDFGGPPGGAGGDDDQLLRLLLERMSAGGAGGAAPPRDIKVDFDLRRREPLRGGLGGLTPPDLGPPGLTPPTPPSPPIMGGPSGVGMGGGPLVPPVPGVQDMIAPFDPTTIIGQPFDPNAPQPSGPGPSPSEPGILASLQDRFRSDDMGQQDYPGSLPFRAGPTGMPPREEPFVPTVGPFPQPSAPDRPAGYGGVGLDALHVHEPRTPGEQEALAGRPESVGQLAAAPEKAGDLSRGRASGELEKLYAMQALGEGLGGMEVVTAGDILHRTAKGVGPGKPRGQALKSYTDFLGRKELGGIGSKDAMALQGLKGKQALEAIEAKGKTDIETAIASKQERVLPAGELSAVDAYHNTRRVGKELLDMMDEMSGSLGPLDNMLDNAGAFFGWQTGKTAEFRRMLSDVLVRHIREMTGQQMSALEIKNLKKTMPVLEDTAKMAKSKLEGVLRHIEDRQEQWAKTRRSAGYYIPEGLGPVGGPGGTVKHKRTGKELEVDGETLQKVRSGSTEWEVLNRSGGTGIF